MEGVEILGSGFVSQEEQGYASRCCRKIKRLTPSSASYMLSVT